MVRNGHLQSVVGIHWPTHAAAYHAKQHPVTLDDGDQIMLHEDATAEIEDDAPIVLLIHGLAGCHLSTYMCRMADRLSTRGYRVFRMDMRGCGAGEGIAKLPSHCGRSTDVAGALYQIAELYPAAETSIVAFSMSGTITLNLLAEAGDMRIGNLKRSFVISPPIDLSHVEQHFRTFWGQHYNRFFVRLIWAQVLRRWELYPDQALHPIPKRPRRLRDIDELVIAPTGGFSSAEDYYAKASPGPKLPAIKQPVTILFSEDDPVVPIEPLFKSLHSSSIETITTHHGGHLGFLSGRHDDPDFRWLDWRIIDWLEEGRKADSGKRKLFVHSSEPENRRPHTSAQQPRTTKSAH